MTQPRVSVVVVAYNMARELPRTLQSLSPAVQQGVASAEYEIIVVDNGSEPPVIAASGEQHGGVVRIVRSPSPSASPVGAINTGLQLARGEIVGVMIDGARMASPGLIAGTLLAARLHHRPVISTLSFHLGDDIQMRSAQHGYDARSEDALLEVIRWPEDGYRLFDIATLAMSSWNGWFGQITESNALFMTAAMWREHGGYDPRFITSGGGFANLDAYARACALPDSQVFMLLGEGTFHQIHGGVTTGGSAWDATEPVAEYMRIRGRRFRPPSVEPILIGRVTPPALSSIAISAGRALTIRRGGARPDPLRRRR